MKGLFVCHIAFACLLMMSAQGICDFKMKDESGNLEGEVHQVINNITEGEK